MASFHRVANKLGLYTTSEVLPDIHHIRVLIPTLSVFSKLLPDPLKIVLKVPHMRPLGSRNGASTIQHIELPSVRPARTHLRSVLEPYLTKFLGVLVP